MHYVHLLMASILLGSPVIAMEAPAKKLKAEDVWLGRALITAIYAWDLPKVENFLKQGAPIDYRTDVENTPLMWASATRCPEITAVLLEAGADPNLVDEDQNSALTHACYYNRAEIAGLLIRAGADVFHVDKNGQSLLMNVVGGALSVYMDEAYATGAVIVEKMLSIPDANQKKRVYTFMNCMKKLHWIEYPNIRNFFKPTLRAMIKEENGPRVRVEIEKIDYQEIRQHLLNKFFPENKQ